VVVELVEILAEGRALEQFATLGLCENKIVRVGERRGNDDLLAGRVARSPEK